MIRIVLLTLAIAITAGGCGAVDTVGERLEDAAGDVRRAGGRFARHLHDYLYAEGCALLRRQAPMVVAVLDICMENDR